MKTRKKKRNIPLFKEVQNEKPTNKKQEK